MENMTKSEAFRLITPFLCQKLREMAESEIDESDMNDAAYDTFFFGKEIAAQTLAVLEKQQKNEA